MENKPVHILCDLFTNRILHITDDLELINTIAKIPETQVLYYVTSDSVRGYRNIPNLPKDNFRFYVLNFMNDSVAFDNKMSNDQQHYFMTIAAKIEAITVIMRAVKTMTAEFDRTPIQTFIHEMKYQEALGGSGVFVSQWAKIKDITEEEASKDILTNSHFQLATLVKSENIRLEYTHKILSQNSPQKVWDIIKEFYLSNFGYHKI